MPAALDMKGKPFSFFGNLSLAQGDGFSKEILNDYVNR